MKKGNKKVYEQAISAISVFPKGEPIFSENSILVKIDDRSDGDRILVSQSDEFGNSETITLKSINEWEAVKQAVDKMFESIKSF